MDINIQMFYIWVMSELILNRLGHSLRNLRKQRGLSQQQLAELAGTSRKAVINAEKGHAGLSLGAFVALAEAMGAEVTAVAARRPTTEEIKTLLMTDTGSSQDARSPWVLPTARPPGSTGFTFNPFSGSLGGDASILTPSNVILPTTKKSPF